MSVMTFEFRPLVLHDTSDIEYECLSKFKNTIRHEKLPDDPLIPLEEYVQGWKNRPAFIEYEAYTVWDPSNKRIIAYSENDIYHTGDNEHAADFMIEVIPEYRQQGIAQQALKLLLPFARKHKRVLLFTYATDHVASSLKFLERLGARAGQKTHVNQLKLAEFDKSILKRWLEHSANKKDEFELGLWDREYPDGQINDVSALYEVVANDQPRDDLELEDMNFSPQFLRDVEKFLFARGDHRWIIYLTDRANGKLAGLTEVMWNPNREMILQQGFTGVYPEYRNKGLGRWLKAEMINKILRERPEVEFIRTENANSNAPMIKINNEMGYKPYIANTIWQVETEKVEKYLRDKH